MLSLVEAQLLNVLLGHEVFSAGQDLAQLHVGGAQADELGDRALARARVHGRLLGRIAGELGPQGDQAHADGARLQGEHAP